MLLTLGSWQGLRDMIDFKHLSKLVSLLLDGWTVGMSVSLCVIST